MTSSPYLTMILAAERSSTLRTAAISHHLARSTRGRRTRGRHATSSTVTWSNW